MHRAGVIILSGWSVLSALPGVGSLIFIFLGHHAPALRMLYSVKEIQAIEPRALATIDGLAVIANALIVMYCVLMFFVIHKCLRQQAQWALYALALGALFIQVAGYVSDQYFMGKNLIILNVSSVILLSGFVLCWLGTRSKT